MSQPVREHPPIRSFVPHARLVIPSFPAKNARGLTDQFRSKIMPRRDTQWLPIIGLTLLSGCMGQPLEKLAAQASAVPLDATAQPAASDLDPSDFHPVEADQSQSTAPNSLLAGLRSPGLLQDATEINDLTETLGLSLEQYGQAMLMSRLLDSDISNIRNVAMDEIRSLLSTHQQQILDGLATNVFDRIGLPEEQRAGAQLAFDALALRLGLTPFQQAAIEALREDARLAIDDSGKEGTRSGGSRSSV
jgi:hypothetical protein